MTQFNPDNLNAEEWNHDSHIMTAAYYCLKSESFFEALSKMKCFVIHFGAERGFTSAQCREKYHETITCFWTKHIWNQIELHNIDTIEKFAKFKESHTSQFNQQLIKDYYDKSILDSNEAKATWIHL